MTTLYKYPRTPHLPWSPGQGKDDKVLKDVEHLKGKQMIGTIKMDGENTTMYTDHIHARSLNSADHESRHWVKGFHAAISHRIPRGWRVCGENLYAKHTIFYDGLPSYFYGFSVWDDRNVCLDWNRTTEFFFNLGIVAVLAFATGSPEEIDEEFKKYYSDEVEGYVIRPADEFRYEDFGLYVAKYVRAGHVQTDKHWMHKKVIPNKLWR